MKSFLFIAFCALFLAGCAVEPPRTPPVAAKPSPPPPEPKKQLSVIQGGGYYLNDGPVDNPPPNIDSIPDAVPKEEALIASCNKPYHEMGKYYRPRTALGHYHAEGVASWYGRRINGAKTSSGEAYDMYGMTAAHPTLPIPSYAKVTNLKTGKSVIVKINDRGPFRSDRLIDLSYTAAHKLGIIRNGSAKVAVDTVMPGEDEINHNVATNSPQNSPQAAGSIYLQLAAFSERINAEHFVERHRPELSGFSPEIVGTGGLYKVHVGPYSNRGDARSAAGRLAMILDINPILTSE
ncbi:MAG: septal ring lytic transglycosylase RlpA family protein [Burkholderiales bacterium]|nr:septal ring lytic transglycosylase RlpA family protein [Burkholderiales bacterium]